MAGAPAAVRNSKFAGAAEIASLVKYAPQREALKTLMREAQNNYKQTVAGGESEGRLNTAAVKEAMPAIQGIYGRGEAATGAAREKLNSELGALGPAANGFKAAAMAQGTAGAEKTTRERDAAESQLRTQGVAAAEAPQFARQLAQGTLNTERQKLGSSAQQLAAQEGANTAAEIAKLSNTAEGHEVTERGQNLGRQSAKEGHAQTERDSLRTAATAEKSAAAKLGAEERKEANAAAGKAPTRKEQHEAADLIGEMTEYAKEIKGTRHEKIAALREGRPQREVKNNSEGKPFPDGNPRTLPGRPKFKVSPLMSAALDEAEFEGVTRNTERRLEGAKYNVPSLRLRKASPVGEGQNKIASGVHKAIEGF
jgi:hypothetical protein